MKHLHFVLLSLALAWTARAQFTVTTVPNFATLVTQIPSSSRPQIRVLGGTTANDGLGYDVIWDAASSTATNTWENGGPIAYPWGSVTGRWKNLASTIWSPRLNGTLAFQSITISEDLSAAGSTAGATKGYVDQNDNVTRAFVNARAVNVVQNQTEMLALAVTTTYAQMAVVRVSTGSDGAAGPWIWDPAATAVESARIKKSPNLSPGDAGRWIKQ